MTIMVVDAVVSTTTEEVAVVALTITMTIDQRTIITLVVVEADIEGVVEEVMTEASTIIMTTVITEDGRIAAAHHNHK